MDCLALVFHPRAPTGTHCNYDDNIDDEGDDCDEANKDKDEADTTSPTSTNKIEQNQPDGHAQTN